MKIGIGNDHRGYKLKNKVVKYLEKKGHEVIDLGAQSEESFDYPDTAIAVGEAVRDKEIEKGILICGSGIGMSIACNKVSGARCAKVNNTKEVIVSRNDNDANVLAFGEKTKVYVVKDMIDSFLKEPFTKLDRYVRRIDKIKEYEQKNES